MDNTIFEFIIDCVVPLLCTVITVFLVPYIKKSVDEKTLNQCQSWAMMAVKCAEIIFKGTGKGTDKKKFVINFLNEKINKNKVVITQEQLNVLIESCVKQLNIEQIKSQ